MTRIREGRPADLPRLRAIQSALAEPWPELLETATEGPPPLYVLEDGLPVGYTLVVGESGTDSEDADGAEAEESGGEDGDGTESIAYVPEFAVHPDQQGQGYGSRLMEWLLDTLADDYEQVRLSVEASDERARGFYRSHGFADVERLPEHFESGDGLLLARDL
jgi:ribosomal-protein-alanine N-acetyltransferase